MVSTGLDHKPRLSYRFKTLPVRGMITGTAARPPERNDESSVGDGGRYPVRACSIRHHLTPGTPLSTSMLRRGSEGGWWPTCPLIPVVVIWRLVRFGNTISTPEVRKTTPRLGVPACRKLCFTH